MAKRTRISAAEYNSLRVQLHKGKYRPSGVLARLLLEAFLFEDGAINSEWFVREKACSKGKFTTVRNRLVADSWLRYREDTNKYLPGVRLKPHLDGLKKVKWATLSDLDFKADRSDLELKADKSEVSELREDIRDIRAQLHQLFAMLDECNKPPPNEEKQERARQISKEIQGLLSNKINWPRRSVELALSSLTDLVLCFLNRGWSLKSMGWPMVEAKSPGRPKGTERANSLLCGLTGSMTAEGVLLFVAVNGEGYASEIARALRVGQAQVYRQLRRFEDCHVLVRRNVGSVALFSLGSRHRMGCYCTLRNFSLRCCAFCALGKRSRWTIRKADFELLTGFFDPFMANISVMNARSASGKENPRFAYCVSAAEMIQYEVWPKMTVFLPNSYPEPGFIAKFATEALSACQVASYTSIATTATLTSRKYSLAPAIC
jgi:hypothetical protein